MTVGISAFAANAQTHTWRTVFHDDFAGASHEWRGLGGVWTTADGELVGRDEGHRGDAIAYRRLAPLLDVQHLEATVHVSKRIEPASWSMAGILLFLDTSNYWMLALVEDQQGRRYVDFLENCNGVWQAQNQPETTLDYTPEKDVHLSWEYNKGYQLRLVLDQDGLAGAVCTEDGQNLLAGGRFTFGKAQAVRMGMAGLIVRDSEAGFDDVHLRVPQVTSASPVANLSVETGPNGNVAILCDALPDLDRNVVDQLRAGLRSEGLGVTLLSAATAANPGVLTPDRFQLYIVPNATVYPGNALPALMNYLRRQGKLLLLGAPAFSRLVWPYQGEWLDRQAVRSMVGEIKADRTILDPDENTDLSTWSRASNDIDSPGSIRVVAGGPDGKGHCLEVRTANLAGWDTYASPEVADMFPAGHRLFCFRAQGDADTPQLSIEIKERDGSRWIAVVALTTDWTYHVLTPADFGYWPDSKAKGRGAPGDELDPQEAVRMTFGLASSHTHKVKPGAHTFRVDDIGTAPDPFADFAEGPAKSLLPVETVYPAYKVYALHDIQRLTMSQRNTTLGTMGALDTDRVPPSLFAAIPRHQGKGFGHDAKWRWIPLIDALDAQDERRGVCCWMLLHRWFPFEGACIATLTNSDARFLAEPQMSSFLPRLARRMCQGVFLLEAGTDKFSYWPDESITIGAKVVNLGRDSVDVTVELGIRHEDDPAVYGRETVKLTIAPGQTGTVEGSAPATQLHTEGHSAAATLRIQGRNIDRIEHDIGILSTRRASADEFVTVRGSDFYLKGRKWYPVGVNFWPLYVAGMDIRDYSLGWLRPAQYQPDEVERDLQRMSTLGINMLSIQAGTKENIPNLLDFMRRCIKYEIKVNAFLGQASPLAFDEAGVREYISEARLSSNPVLFAYDTIWEPGNYVFRKDRRPSWDQAWLAWIAERYGSIEKAERDWGMSAPRSPEGKVTSPSDRQLREDGNWRVMVAAYRRFMDDLTSRKWNRAHRRLRELDPNHLVSFRQGNTLPQDFTFTATPKHIDFICPEGYAIHFGDDGCNASGFITRYVHFTTRGKPVLWSEFGKSIWDRATMQPDSAAAEQQSEYHDQFYRMVLQSGANGTAPWWWPGGYRVNERSDYGICNPDGTPRASAQLIAKYAPQIKADRAYPEPDTWLTVDRDAHPGGYWYLAFNTGRDAYAEAVRSGHHLGIRTDGTGTTSVDTPLLAVGNTPCNGANPPKYLNAEFNWVKVRTADGAWTEATDGAAIRVNAGAPVRLRVSVGNTQEATWLTAASAAGKPGAVYLASTPQSQVTLKRPVPRDTAYLHDADFAEFELLEAVTGQLRVELQMTAEERVWFGEKRTFTLQPQ